MFDGHGGSKTLMKVPKFRSLWKDISLKNLQIIATTEKTTKKHSGRPSSEWTSCFSSRRARMKLRSSKSRWEKEKTVPNTMRSRMLAALLTWCLSLQSRSTAQMQAIHARWRTRIIKLYSLVRTISLRIRSSSIASPKREELWATAGSTADWIFLALWATSNTKREIWMRRSRWSQRTPTSSRSKTKM